MSGGDIDTKLDIFEDWEKEFEKGVVYYLDGGRVRGAMMCNVWDKVPVEREMILKAEKLSQNDLRGAIR